MNHLPFTILAYFFNASAVTIDKFMLAKHIPNPLLYIFYFSAFSALALLLLPWTHLPTPQVFLLASISTVLWTSGAYLMFKALQIGQVSRVIPIIGTLIPVFLVLEATTSKSISSQQVVAVLSLVLGLILLTIKEWKGKISKQELLFELTAALLFAVSYLVLRQAYLQDDFLTVLVWSRFIIIPVSLIILFWPSLKQKVFSASNSQPTFKLFSKPGLLFLAGQAAGGSSELLITYSVSLATPALVNSLQGSQYAFIFFFSLILGRRYPQIFQEKYSETLTLVSKILGILAIAFGLYLLAQ